MSNSSTVLVLGATGGIGGVHRGDPTDVSADLPQMQRTLTLIHEVEGVVGVRRA